LQLHSCLAKQSKAKQSKATMTATEVDYSETTQAGAYYYLCPRAAAALPVFKYRGQDKSLIYKHILSPLAQHLVDHHTPTWAAPNAITLFGMCWMVASYVLVWHFYPGFDEGISGGSPPLWPFAFSGIAMLVYQTLDNMDGKQSRKTGSSSPLGLLFDHGCDAINSIFGSGMLITALGLSPATDQWHILASVLLPMMAFYVTTWEEYYTHHLILPTVNGPTEGLLMGAALFVCTSVVGVEYWHGYGWYNDFFGPYVFAYLPESITSAIVPVDGLRNCDMFTIISVLGMGQEVCINKGPKMVCKFGISCLRELFPIISLIVAPILIGYADSTVLERHPRVCLHIIAGLFVEAVTQLMLDHMTSRPYRAVRPAIVPLWAFTALIWFDLIGPRMADELLVSYQMFLVVHLYMKFSVIIHEICDLLQIWCFDIVTPYPKKKKKSA
jgi:ethanolaminephosphotransferase